MTPLDILSAGRIYCDLVFSGLEAPPAPGREVYATGLTVVPGGGALITARYAQALGMRAGVWGVRPAAPFDRIVTDDLVRAGVADMTAPAEAGADPQVTVAIPVGGDRAFLTRRTGAALPDGPLPPARHLHIGELATLVENPGLVALARQAGMTVSLDCSWDDATLARSDLADFVALVDVFLPNEAEATCLASRSTVTRPRVAVVEKRGPSGATARLSTGEIVHAAARSVDVTDTTGAGDAFNAGFLTGWLRGWPVARCLSLGNACGAVAVGRLGGGGDIQSLTHLTTHPDGAVPGLEPAAAP
ncbi:MAG: PfkB family carbohydrate kinase [Rhodobacteraceae bacterium]|nr:PfkB family carbohydrate kinase [Paracoccaceae bacterium]